MVTRGHVAWQRVIVFHRTSRVVPFRAHRVVRIAMVERWRFVQPVLKT
jgi:hypothetical protein